MVRDGDYIAIFNSIHRVMKAEKLLKEHRLAILLIPAPRTLHADCGLAIRYTESEKPEVERLLAQDDLAPEEQYRRQGERYERVFVGGSGDAISP